MSQESRIEVINRDGWHKEYPLQKGIVYIGSAPTNDIVLSGTHGVGVAPLHAQLIAATGGEGGYKLVNLSDQDIQLGSAGDELLSPRAVMGMPDGATIRLGEFTLVFRGSGGGGYAGFSNGSGSQNIGLRIALPQTRLAPHQILEGAITIRNLGGKTGARFDVILEGFDEGCFEIEPGPLLSSGAEKDISFRLYHQGTKPLAGEWTFVIRAMAAKAYPGEQAQIFQTVEVLPHYQHQARLLPAKGITITSPPREDMGLARSTINSRERPARPQPEPEVQEEWWTTSTGAEDPTPAPRSDVRRLKAQPVVVTPPVSVSREESPAEAEADWTAAPVTRPPAQAPPPPAEAEADWDWSAPTPGQTAQVTPAPPPPAAVPPVTVTEPAEEWRVETKPVAPVTSPAPVAEFRPEPAQAETNAELPLVLPVTIPEPESEREVEIPIAPSPPAAEVQPEPPLPTPLPPAQPVPPAEPSLVTKWWSRLKEALPFSGREVESMPAEENRPSPKVEQPVLLAAEPKQYGELTPAGAETLPATKIEEEVMEEDAVITDSQTEPREIEPALPESPAEEAIPALEHPVPAEEVKPSPPVAEAEDWWAEEAETLPPVETEQAAQPAVSPATEEEPPVESDDWWGDQEEKRPKAVVELQAKVEPQPEAVVTEAPAEAPAKSDDWWEFTAIEARTKTEEQPIIKLKATPAQTKQPESPKESDEDEAWWTVDMEQTEKK